MTEQQKKQKQDDDAEDEKKQPNKKKKNKAQREVDTLMQHWKAGYRTLCRQAQELILANLPPPDTLVEHLRRISLSLSRKDLGALSAPLNSSTGAEKSSSLHFQDPNTQTPINTNEQQLFRDGIVQYYRLLMRNATQLLLEHLPEDKTMIHMLLSKMKPDKAVSLSSSRTGNASTAVTGGANAANGANAATKRFHDSEEEGSDCESLDDTKGEDDQDLYQEQESDADEHGNLQDFVVHDEPQDENQDALPPLPALPALPP